MSNRLILLFLLISGPVFSQSTSDTLFVQQESKSPAGAMLRSAILPGWGQVYTGSYLKAPLILGTFATFGGIAWWYHDRYTRYQGLTRDAYDAPNQELEGRPATLYRAYREFYRDERDRYLFYVFLTYMVNIADAYVEAHLADFDVSGDLSVKPSPEPADPSAGMHPVSYHLTWTLTF